jgi:hypothetical protein
LNIGFSSHRIRFLGGLPSDAEKTPSFPGSNKDSY